MRTCLLPRLILLISAVLGGCAVGPNFTAPDAKAPPAWFDIERVQNPPDDMRIPHAMAPSLAITNADPDPRWWTQYNGGGGTDLPSVWVQC